MPVLEANGCRFHVALDGPVDAPGLVLSNSLGATLAMWQPQVEAFARHFRVLRYDARGHGRSAVTPGPYTVGQLAADVLALVDAAGLREPCFCGLSMGGATGLWLAAHAEDRFRRYVVCNSVPWLGLPDTMLARAAQVRRDGLTALAGPTLERWFTAELRAREPATVAAVRDAFVATPVEGYAACCEALAQYDVRDAIGSITAPVLAIAGTHDPAPAPAVVAAWARRIPGARYLELPAAHLSNLGAPAAFETAVLEFLGGRA